MRWPGDHGHNRSMPGTLAVLLNLTSFGLTTLALVGLLIGVSLLYRAPTRPCHRCDRRVPLGRGHLDRDLLPPWVYRADPEAGERPLLPDRRGGA
jgi:hypothetical protein